jgi:hypothetical protein
MVETLRRRGFTSVVVTPRLGDALPGNPLDVFARDPIPLERFLAGRQINLSPERVLWGGKRETERAAVTAILAAGRAPLEAAIRQAEGKPAVAGRPLGGWTVAFEPSATYDAMVRADGPKSWRVGASRAGGPSGAVRHEFPAADWIYQLLGDDTDSMIYVDNANFSANMWDSFSTANLPVYFPTSTPVREIGVAMTTSKDGRRKICINGGPVASDNKSQYSNSATTLTLGGGSVAYRSDLEIREIVSMSAFVDNDDALRVHARPYA